MPDPPDAPYSRDFAPQSSDQANQYPQQAYGCYDAPEGNACAQGLYVTRNQAIPLDSPLIYPDCNPHQPPQVAPGQISNYYNFDPSAQATWDCRQSVDFTSFATHYEPQGEIIQELQDHKSPTSDFSIPFNPLSSPLQPLPQRLAVSLAMKRKSGTELQSAAQKSANEQSNLSKRRAMSRASSTASQSSPTPTFLADAQPLPMDLTDITQAATKSADPSNSQGSSEAQWRNGVSKGTGPSGRVIDVSEPRRVVESSGGGDMLPAGRVFPIQIGSALFRLSGASLCSDAPSYFSHFFGEQLHNNGGRANDVRTLYIDRDPDTFRDIALHLQGYHIVPRDGEHFVKLFADAQFYSLPRLTKQLFKSDIFIRIGGISFQIPRDTFSAPGDSPNYFSLGFAQWFSTPSEVFPGLDRNTLLRPPSISPPSVPNKSGETFGELMKMLQGYDVEIRNDVHRSQLLRDARYFHLKGLEQRLIPHQISYNLKRQHSEILMRLEDIRQSGVSFIPEGDKDASLEPSSKAGLVSYARPYTSDAAANHVLILETSSSESTTLFLPAPSPSPSNPPAIHARAAFHADTLRRITSLFSVIASKMNLPSTQPLGLMHMQTATGLSGQPPTPASSGLSEALVKVRLDDSCALDIDALSSHVAAAENGSLGLKRVSTWIYGGAKTDALEMVVKRAHWRVAVESVGGGKVQVVLWGVRIDAFTQERMRNAERRFLGSA